MPSSHRPFRQSTAPTPAGPGAIVPVGDGPGAGIVVGRLIDRGTGLAGVELKVAGLAGQPDLDALLTGVEAMIVTANTASTVAKGPRNACQSAGTSHQPTAATQTRIGH